MPLPYTITRQQEIDKLLVKWNGSHCVSVVGLSNTGKSTLLRSLNTNDVIARYIDQTGRRVAIVYIDCNGMLELSGQGFYELIVRNVREKINDLDEHLTAKLEEQYMQIIEPDTQFLVPLSFNNAMTAIIEEDHRDLILLFDEFDEAFDALDGRAFLNLRALKDKYQSNLIYVTATVRLLGSKRSDEETAEFVELFAPNTIYLNPLTREESNELATVFAKNAGLEMGLSPEEQDFLWLISGGHPRFLRAAVSHLVELHLQGFEDFANGGFDRLWEELAHDVTIRRECTRIWSQLGPDERTTLLVVADSYDNGDYSSRHIVELIRWGLLKEDDEAGIVIFARLFDDFVQRQVEIQQEHESAIQIDMDSGEVWVRGVPTSPLTELEFKLMSILFSRLNKLTDKYQIVETVWGVDYIEKVDDARIEKLVSRLRAKIEPDASDPRYLITVRGRGYKLVSSD